VKIEFDPVKDKANSTKHGQSLSFAAELDWDAMQVRPDDAEDYGEDRWIGVAPSVDRLYTVVFTVRDEDTMRIISLRRATNIEIQSYEDTARKQAKVQAQRRRRGGKHPRRGRGRS
jgi:uncharacterized protein